MFYIKNAVIYMFLGMKSVQNTDFESVFNALASQTPWKHRYLPCSFIFVRFSVAGNLPKRPKIPSQYPLRLRHPEMVQRTRKHQQNPGSVRYVLRGPPQLKLI